MAYVATSFVFGEQPSASKWNQLGGNDATFDALIGSGTAWSTWSPTYANLTIGNGTSVAKYQQFGKTIHATLSVTFGSTSAMGTNPTFSLPQTAAGTGSYPTASLGAFPIGVLHILDSGTGTFTGTAVMNTTTTALMKVYNAAGTYLGPGNIDASNPMVWTTSDAIYSTITYQAA